MIRSCSKFTSIWFMHALLYVSFCRAEANLSLSEYQIRGARKKASIEWDKALGSTIAPLVQAAILEPSHGSGVIELCEEIFTNTELIAELAINPTDTQSSHIRSGHISLTVDGYMFGTLKLLNWGGDHGNQDDTSEYDFKVNSGGNFVLLGRECFAEVCVPPGSLMPWQHLKLNISDLACPGTHELRIQVHLFVHEPGGKVDRPRAVVAAATSRFDLVVARALARPSPRAAFPVGGMALDAAYEAYVEVMCPEAAQMVGVEEEAGEARRDHRVLFCLMRAVRPSSVLEVRGGWTERRIRGT